MTNLKYPLKSHRKIINIPKHSVKTAELFGIIIGDGSIWNKHQFKISLNAVSDYNYSIFVKKLIEELFNIKSYSTIRKNENTMVITTSSTSAVEYLIKNGIVSRNKIKNQIDIPTWIIKNKYYSRAVVRGLTDTDGCLYLHYHKVKNKKYCNIGYCFTSYSVPLIKSVTEIFNNNDIKYKIVNNCRVYLYSKKEIKKYMDIFGTSNNRIIKIYKEWNLKNKLKTYYD